MSIKNTSAIMKECLPFISVENVTTDDDKCVYHCIHLPQTTTKSIFSHR